MSAGEEQHFLDPREVDHRREHREVEERRAVVVDRVHAADRHALGEDVPQAGGHHDVAGGDAGAVARHELEPHDAVGSPSTSPVVRVRCTIAPTVEAGSFSSCTTEAAGRTRTTRPTRPWGTMTGVWVAMPLAAAAVDGQRAHPAAGFAADDLAADGRDGQPASRASRRRRRTFS